MEAGDLKRPELFLKMKMAIQYIIKVEIKKAERIILLTGIKGLHCLNGVKIGPI